MFRCFKKKKEKKKTLPDLFKVNENYSRNENDESDYCFNDTSSHIYEVIRFSGSPTSPEVSCSSLSKPPTPPSSGYWSDDFDDDGGFETSESDAIGHFDSLHTKQINPNFSAIKNASYLSPLQKRDSNVKCEINCWFDDYKPKVPPRNSETTRSALHELARHTENPAPKMPHETIISKMKTDQSSCGALNREQLKKDSHNYRNETMQKTPFASKSCVRTRNIPEQDRYINMTPMSKRPKTNTVHLPRSRKPMTSELKEEMDSNNCYYEKMISNASSHTQEKKYVTELYSVSKNLYRAQRVETLVANMDKPCVPNIRNERNNTRSDDAISNNDSMTSLPRSVHSGSSISEGDNSVCRNICNNFRNAERNVTGDTVSCSQSRQFAENRRYLNSAVTDVRCTKFPIYRRSTLKPQTLRQLSAPRNTIYHAHGAKSYTPNRLLSEMTSRNNDIMLLRI